MLPNKSGKIQTNRNFENLVDIMLENFKNENSLELKNKDTLTEGKFILKKRNQIFNPFDRKLIMSEIKGKIHNSQIDYKIEMSNLMKLIFFVNTIFLIILSIGFILNEEYQTGLVIIGFTIFITVITYFWLKSELNYLEDQFKEKMRYI